MLKIGAMDRFEREYTQKFRTFCAQFGEFVTYERDRAARDIGLHLTHKLRSGRERLSSALCWFQLKGITKDRLPEAAFNRSATIGIPLKVRHLRYWYLQPMPTYLALYVESADTFLVTNLQRYVEQRWGRGILTLNQDTATIEVPGESVLDDQAFHVILAKSDMQEWARALGDDMESTRLCRRDYDLIWHIGTASRRKVTHRFRIIAWQTKTRGEIHIEESTRNPEEWLTLRNHWQYMLRATDVEEVYPYLKLYALEDDELWEEERDYDLWGDENNRSATDLMLANGDIVRGKDVCGEFFEYVVGARLNHLGKRLLKSVRELERIGLIEINEGIDEWISIAPWDQRSV